MSHILPFSQLPQLRPMSHPRSADTSPPQPSPQRPRFLSEADCHDVARRLARYARGGGDTNVVIGSVWTGTVRWGRNRITTSTEDRDNKLQLTRIVQGALAEVQFNEVSDAALVAATRRAERLLKREDEHVEFDIFARPDSPFRPQEEPGAVPQLFSDVTYQLDAEHRTAAARQCMQSATEAGLLTAGYIKVSAHSLAYITSWGYSRYYQYTWAQYSVTVRDPKGTGSGWAGVDWPDWNKIDGMKLSQIALEKCLASRNPVRVEPGRYTTILEPQAVSDFLGLLMFSNAIGREANETTLGASFHKSGEREPPTNWPIGYSKLGERVMDERITISVDPMDPELGFPPYPNLFSGRKEIGATYHPAVWIEHGALKTLAYDRKYAIELLGRETGLLNPGAFRMSVSGPMASVEEMVQSTKRGLLVTRFDPVDGPIGPSLLCRGYTRDGLWLIENGKISKPVKNMLFVEGILFVLNNVEQVGVPQRAFHPQPDWKRLAWDTSPQPVIVPPLKIRDFSFTALSDAI